MRCWGQQNLTGNSLNMWFGKSIGFHWDEWQAVNIFQMCCETENDNFPEHIQRRLTFLTMLLYGWIHKHIHFHVANVETRIYELGSLYRELGSGEDLGKKQIYKWFLHGISSPKNCQLKFL